jgi:hypothetical protein
MMPYILSKTKDEQALSVRLLCRHFPIERPYRVGLVDAESPSDDGEFVFAHLDTLKTHAHIG